MILNKYIIESRLFPTIICIFPLFIVQYFFLNEKISGFLNYLGGIEFIGNTTFSLVLLYLMMQINRTIGKTFFEKRYYQDGQFMPTTNFLMISNNEYSKDYKLKVRRKIKTDFDIELADEIDEKNNETRARKKIAEAISLIRYKVGDGRLLLQHNIEYGFTRNLIGGAIPAIFFSLVNIYFALNIHDNFVLIISIIACSFFLILIVFSKNILTQKGRSYAKILFQEYSAMK